MLLIQRCISLKHQTFRHSFSGLVLLLLITAMSTVVVHAETVKVAFIGDQGVDENARAVLSLVANEGTDLLLIQGDLGYEEDSASKWEKNLDDALGENFPVLTVVGNHENFEWPIYQHYIQRRIDRVDALTCSGNTGVKVSCSFKNIDIVQVSPGIYEVDGVNADDDYAGYIQQSFSETTTRWRICSWHKNQNKLQTGRKSDRTGWGVYEACLNAGAMVALAHEHAYSRTHLLSNFEEQTVVHTRSDMTLEPGRSFSFVSGLGGQSIRSQVRGGDWWASIYTATQGATHGALFCEFEATTAECYFKAIDGAMPDQFSLRLADGSEQSGTPNNSEEPVEQSGTPSNSEEPAEQSGTPDNSEEPAEQSGTPSNSEEPVEQSGTPDNSEEPAEQSGTTDNSEEPAEQSGTTDNSEEPAEQSGTPDNSADVPNQTETPLNLVDQSEQDPEIAEPSGTNGDPAAVELPEPQIGEGLKDESDGLNQPAELAQTPLPRQPETDSIGDALQNNAALQPSVESDTESSGGTLSTIVLALYFALLALSQRIRLRQQLDRLA